MHLPPLFKCQRTRLLEQTWRESDLPDVVNESAEMRQLLLFIGEAEPPRCPAHKSQRPRSGRLYSDLGHPTWPRVPSRTKCWLAPDEDSRRSDPSASSLSSWYRPNRALRRKRRPEEERERPRRNVPIGERENRNQGCIKGYGEKHERNKGPKKPSPSRCFALAASGRQTASMTWDTRAATVVAITTEAMCERRPTGCYPAASPLRRR